MERLGQGAVIGKRKNILGQHKDDRPRHTRLRQMKGAHHEFADLLGLAHLPDGLCHAAKELRVVYLLERAATALRARHLADQHDQRRCILLRHMDGDRSVAGAGTAANHETLRLARDLRLRHRHETGARLVPAHDRLDAVGIVQRIEKSEIALAGNAVNA
jgi:hypothetical protein